VRVRTGLGRVVVRVGWCLVLQRGFPRFASPSRRAGLVNVEVHAAYMHMLRGRRVPVCPGVIVRPRACASARASGRSLLCSAGLGLARAEPFPRQKTTLITETSQDISDLRNMKGHQGNINFTTSPHHNSMILTSFTVELMTLHLPLPKLKTPTSTEH